MSAPVYLPVAKMYTNGTTSCWRVTEKQTAWIDYKAMSMIIGWGVTRDEDGKHAALKETGILLTLEELKEL